MRSVLTFSSLFILYLSVTAFAQFKDPLKESPGSTIDGGVGLTWIDDQPYTTLTIAPDLSFGKFGIGLYLQFLFDNNNNLTFRDDEYSTGSKILKAIRYIRYGQKYDPEYFRIGSLNRTILANGFLVWNYNNGSSYDQRKVGLVADVDLGKAGFESMWSSIGTSNLWGVNTYIRPFRLSSSPIPILDQLRIYGTVVQDSKIQSTVNTDTTLTAYGIGVDLQWLNTPVIKSTIYSDFSKYKDFGNGKVFGINIVFPEFIGVFGLSARYEKRFLGRQFVPSLFGPLYDLERQIGSNFSATGAWERLESAEKTQGYFGELAGHVLNRIRLIGSYQKLNGITNSGILHLEASAPNLIPKFELLGYYDKSGIETFSDARTLDTSSILTAEVAYQLNSFLLLTTIYRWYWVEQEDGAFKPIERIEPRLSFRYNF